MISRYKRVEAEPIIMVNPLGCGDADGPDGRRLDMLPNFVHILIEEVMPQVEKQHNASTKRTDHAVAGLSMGGPEATLGGLNHLDKFARIGSFSGAYNLWPLTRPAEQRETAGEVAPGRAPGPGAGPGRGPGPGFPNLVLVKSQLPNTFPGLDARANAQIKLLWIACGTADGLTR